MARTWVLVADSTRARIFSADRPLGSIEEIETLAHPEGRVHEQQITSDLPGRSFDSGGQGRHAMSSTVDPKRQGIIDFAKRIGDHLEAARVRGNFERLIIIAAPMFLGLIRDNLSNNTIKHVIKEINKNLAQFDAKEIRQHLPERL